MEEARMNQRTVSHTRWLIGVLALLLLTLAACQVTMLSPEPGDDQEMSESADAVAMSGDPIAGEMVFNTAVGCGCHFNGDLGALAGGNDFSGDHGTVFTANLTPHETGTLHMSDAEFADAIRYRRGHEGENLFPAMPAYAAMSDEDVMNLVAYLRTLEPVENEVPARELNFDPPAFEASQPSPATAPTDGADRGRYLATIARCGRCHTPSNEDGSPNMEMLLAGAPFRDTVAPNITSDEATGIGLWTEQELADFLGTGVYSDGTEAHGGMMSQVNGGIGKLGEADRLAIAAFLKSLPPVVNEPATPQ